MTPNIVFFFVDDMGVGDASCLNPDGKIKTPHIDRLAAEGGGRMAVIGLSGDQAVRSVSERYPTVAVLDPAQAKGLEFDAVLVMEPADIIAQEAGVALIYIAVTRATRRLGIAHTKPLPASLVGLVSG